MPEVFYNKEGSAVVGERWLEFLKDAARSSPLRRARFCLHRSPDDQVHEMVIAMCRDVLFRPHRHKNKTESFHLIEGDLNVILFDESGKPVSTIRMGPPGSGQTFFYRLCVPQWHAILPNSEIALLHETTSGPFVQGAAEFAPWSPSEPAELRTFLERSVAAALINGGGTAAESPRIHDN